MTDDDDGYDDPPAPQSRQRPRHRGHPDRLRHARHRRRLWLPHLRHRRPARSRRRSSSPTVRRTRSFHRADQKSARVAGSRRRARAATSGWFRAKSSRWRLPGTSSVPRVVFPSPVQPVPTTTGTTPSARCAGWRRSDQPKRVRTVPIRPEGGDTSGRPYASDASARGLHRRPRTDARRHAAAA